MPATVILDASDAYPIANRDHDECVEMLRDAMTGDGVLRITRSGTPSTTVLLRGSQLRKVEISEGVGAGPAGAPGSPPVDSRPGATYTLDID